MKANYRVFSVEKIKVPTEVTLEGGAKVITDLDKQVVQLVPVSDNGSGSIKVVFDKPVELSVGGVVTVNFEVTS